ncbi:MAG: TonB-dependent receptor [Bryobacteraceae bacterium]|nr:TonB-dependent receptor [Bryobacteraceae bacterium]
MNPRNVWTTAATLLLLIAFQGDATAQIAQGSISGMVTDSTGAVLPGVQLTVENAATGLTQKTVTDETGNYLFPTITSGNYRIRAEREGFDTYIASGLEIQVAQRVRHNIELSVGRVAVQTEVVATAPVLEQRSAEIGQVIGGRQIRDLPLNGRNFLALARLVPGVSQFPRGFQSTGISINGQRGNQIAFFFDGIDTRVEHSGKPAFTPSIEATQEFRIQQNAFTAEFGRAPAAINLSLSPGTNDFHGTLFEFLRNDKLDGRSFFAPRRDALRRNQFGFVFSGPVLPKRTFFMTNFEGLRERRSRSIFANVPSDLQRQGNFAGDSPIFDPLTFNTQTRQRNAFPNNLIPESRFGQIGKAALKFYPAANLTGVRGFNFVAPASLVDDGDQFHTRIDHQISDRGLLFGRYSWASTQTDSPAGLPLTGSIINVDTQNFTIQESHTFSPTVLNQFRVGYTYYNLFSGFPVADRNLAVEEFGLANLNPPSSSFGLPQLAVAGLNTIGANAFSPQGTEEHIYTLADDLNLVRGRNNLKFGVEGRYYRPALPILATPNGIITVLNRFSSQPNVANSGSPVADLVLGFPWSGRGTQLVESNGLVSLKYSHVSFYGQDEIRLSPKLTANVGLRYELQSPYKERFNDLFIFDYVNGRFLEPGVDIDNLQRPDRNNFAPRVGLAYSLNSKTVIRAGAGLFYGLIRTQEFPAFHLSPPFTVDSTLFSDPLVPDLPGRLFPRAVVRDGAGKILLTPNTGVFSLDHDYRTAYTYQWNFSIQRELAPGWLLETAYVGNSAHKLIGRDLVNQAFLDPDPARNPTPVNGRRPNPSIGDVSMVKSLDNSNYHGLNVKLDKRFAKGFSILSAYTYSKAIGVGGAIFGDQSNTQDGRNRRAEYGPLEFNQKHRLTAGWIYELPFGRGQAIGGSASGLVNKLIEGWMFQGIYTAHTGFNLTPADNVSSNVGRQDSNRPNRLCNGNLPKSGRTLDRYFDTTCFAQHAFGRFGDAGPGVLFGPGMNNFDIGLTKVTRVGMGRKEPMTIQFRTELFNALNHAQFGDPGLVVGTPQYGIIRSTRVGGREMQFALKLIF